MKKLLLFLMSASLLLAAASAKADTVTITLTEPFQSIGGAGGVLVFDATVTNTTGSTVFLNGDSFNVDSPLSLTDLPYDNNFPFSLPAFGSASGELFDVDVPADTPGGLYTGAFEITGGSDGAAGNVIGTADFNVQITPEPSSLLLLATGLAGVGGALRRRITHHKN